MPDSHPDRAALHRAASIRVIHLSGGYAVKARPGRKEPAAGWDPRSNNAAKSAQTLSQVEFSSDNIGLHFHGTLVDVDVDGDCPALMAALDEFLPPCPHTWGRPSRPRTHRLYQLKVPDKLFDPAQHPVLKRLKRIEEVKVELRGGPASRGEYSLLPGSRHPEGELYEWDDLDRAASTPAVVEPARLFGALRKAGTVAVASRFWMEGHRQTITMALGGFMHRCMAIASALGPGRFMMDLDESLAFLDSMMKALGDDPSDAAARRKAFKQSWAKAGKGAAVTGATSLADFAGDKSLVGKLYALLSDNPSVEAIDEFARRFAVWRGPALAVDLDAVARGDPRPYMSRRNFASSYGDQFVEVDNKRKLLPELLWSLPSATRVSGLTFDPSNDDRLVTLPGGDHVNVWTGFAVSPEEGDPSLFIDYLMGVVCSNDKEVFDWVLAWCADIFQRPADKPGTALVLVGEEGAGKSILGHLILGKLIGAAHYASTNDVASLTRNFNALFSNRLLIQCDEATSARQKAQASKLKSLITDPHLTVEPKGVDPYVMPSHARMLFTSNDLTGAIQMSAGLADRRYTVIHVSDSQRGNVDSYWGPFVEWLASPKGLSSVMYLLTTHKYKEKLLRRPLMTRAKILMQEGSWPTFDAWLRGMAERDHPVDEAAHLAPWEFFTGTPSERELDREWPKWMVPAALARGYSWYLKSLPPPRSSAALDEGQIMRRLRELGLLPEGEPRRRRVKTYDDRKGLVVVKRVRVYPAISQGALLDYLNRRYGYEAEEIEDEQEE